MCNLSNSYQQRGSFSSFKTLLVIASVVLFGGSAAAQGIMLPGPRTDSMHRGRVIGPGIGFPILGGGMQGGMHPGAMHGGMHPGMVHGGVQPGTVRGSTFKQSPSGAQKSQSRKTETAKRPKEATRQSTSKNAKATKATKQTDSSKSSKDIRRTDQPTKQVKDDKPLNKPDDIRFIGKPDRVAHDPNRRDGKLGDLHDHKQVVISRVDTFFTRHYYYRRDGSSLSWYWWDEPLPETPTDVTKLEAVPYCEDDYDDNCDGEPRLPSNVVEVQDNKQQTTDNTPQPLCGPDVTDAVLEIIKDIKKDYDGLKAKDAEAADKACSNLTSVSTGGDAWDITGLDPSTSAQEGQKVAKDGLAYTDAKEIIKLYPWFTSISEACAIPRPQCAATVEFMGRCVHAQKLNYIQWGAMKTLCKGGLKFDAVKMAYGITQSAALDVEQQDIINVRKEYVDALGNNANPDLGAIKKQWQRMYDVKWRKLGQVFSEERKCKLGCQLTDTMKAAIKKQLSGYKWTGIPGHKKN